MAKLSVGPNGIRKTISKIPPLEAIFEYVWNGFDASATKIDIKYEGLLGGLSTLSISDNGTGIPFAGLDRKFGRFLDSEKANSDGNSKRHNSETRGKRGYGRLTFDVFCDKAEWHTVFKKGEINQEYVISVTKRGIDEYHPDPSKPDPSVISSKATGTSVIFSNIYGLTAQELDELLLKELAREFCWFLELNKATSYSISVNGKIVDYSFMIAERKEESWVYRPSDTRFDLDYVEWSEKPNDESSRFYYINSNDREVYTETTKLNRKGDGFYNSVYIKSPFFDDFDFSGNENGYNDLGITKNKRSSEFRFLQDNITKLMDAKRKPFLEKRSQQIISELQVADSFPKYDRSDPVSRYQHDELVTLVRELYQVEPQIFSQLNKDQKKVFVRFLDLILQSGERERLFNILDEIIGLEPSEREELNSLIKSNKLQNIIKTTKIIEDRYRAIEDLKQIVFSNEWNAREVEHVQAFIDKHYWILGEQSRLITSTEPDFQVALGRFQHYLRDSDDDTYTSSDIIEHPDRNKEMDLFAVKKDVWNDKIQSIVV